LSYYGDESHGAIGAESNKMYSIEEVVEDTHYFTLAKYKDKIPDPMDCAACGKHKKGEGLHYIAAYGYHHWIQPNDEMILKRMKERRARKNC
jgi:hypothetical protein